MTDDARRGYVCIRPIRAEDSPLLAGIFAQLSPASRFARFLMPKRELTAAELRYFTDIHHALPAPAPSPSQPGATPCAHAGCA